MQRFCGKSKEKSRPVGLQIHTEISTSQLVSLYRAPTTRWMHARIWAGLGLCSRSASGHSWPVGHVPNNVDDAACMAQLQTGQLIWIRTRLLTKLVMAKLKVAIIHRASTTQQEFVTSTSSHSASTCKVYVHQKLIWCLRVTPNLCCAATLRTGMVAGPCKSPVVPVHMHDYNKLAPREGIEARCSVVPRVAHELVGGGVARVARRIFLFGSRLPSPSFLLVGSRSKRQGYKRGVLGVACVHIPSFFKSKESRVHTSLCPTHTLESRANAMSHTCTQSLVLQLSRALDRCVKMFCGAMKIS